MMITQPRTVTKWRERLLSHVTVSRFYLVSVAVFFLALSLLLGHSAFGEYVLAICILFTAIFFGLVGLTLSFVRGSREEVPPFDVDQPSGELFTTFTGPLKKGEAKLQLMIIPAAVVIGFLALALVDLWARALAL